MECVSSNNLIAPLITDWRFWELNLIFDFVSNSFSDLECEMKLGRGTSNHMLKISHVANVVYAFQCVGDLGQSLGSDACHAVDCNKLGQVRHKTIGSPKKRGREKKAQLLLDVPSPLRKWWAQRIKYAWARRRARHTKGESARERGGRERVGQWYAHIINTLLGLWINI